MDSRAILIVAFDTGEIQSRYTHDYNVRSLAFSADARRLIIADSNEYTFGYDLADWGRRTIYRPAGDYEIAESLHASKDGSLVFSGLGSKQLVVHDAATGAPLRQFEYHDAPVSAIAFDPENRRVLAGSSNGGAAIWSLDSDETAARISLGTVCEISEAAFFPDGTKVILVPGPSAPFTSALVFDAATGALLYRLPADLRETACGALSADGRKVLIASSDGELIEHDISVLEAFTGDQCVYLAAALSHGVGICSGSEKRDILMQSAPGDLLASLLQHLKHARTLGLEADAAQSIEVEIDTSVRRASALLRREPFVPDAPSAGFKSQAL